MIKINVEKSITVRKGCRLYELMSRHYSILAEEQASWGKLFRTKAYHRKMAHAEKVRLHYHAMIKRQLEGDNIFWKGWNVERHGADTRIAVEMKQDQWYRIVCID